MKTGRLFFLFVILVVLASCQFHQSNFSKRKFLDLKKMKDKEVVATNNDEANGFEQATNNVNIEDIESGEPFTNIESENIPSTDIEITTDEIEVSNVDKIENVEESKNVNQPQQISKTPQADESKKENPKSTDQLFKLASLFFLLGLLLILFALVGLFKSVMSEQVGFVPFFLGLIAMVISSIFAIKGSNQRTKEKSKKTNNNRRDFVLFFGVFFIVLSLMMIHGNV